jgi:hypothetical protein
LTVPSYLRAHPAEIGGVEGLADEVLDTEAP